MGRLGSMPVVEDEANHNRAFLPTAEGGGTGWNIGPDLPTPHR